MVAHIGQYTWEVDKIMSGMQRYKFCLTIYYKFTNKVFTEDKSTIERHLVIFHGRKLQK